MKAKPIINDSNFHKLQNKQPLFIVRPKPAQPRLNPPLNRDHRQPSPQQTQKSIDQCLAGLEAQLADEQAMPRALCLKTREHLLALRLKCSPQQQTYNDNKRQLESPQMPLSKPSAKFLKPQKSELFEETRNKQNYSSIQTLGPSKMGRGKSHREGHQQEVQALENKLKEAYERVEQHERDCQSLVLKIRLLEGQVEREEKEKVELRMLLEKKDKTERALKEQTEALEGKCKIIQAKCQTVSECLSERERQIVALWQLLAK